MTAVGDVVLIAFPFTDLSAAKVRPALVVGHAGAADVIVIFITSNLANAGRTDVVLDSANAEFVQSGLRVSSRITVARLATLEEGLIRRTIGSAGAETLRGVRDALRLVLHL
ncbi:MAG: type II toxin-antitoxin system PemK/MazF family toxin [Tepidiformaceae bacterium]